MPTLFRLLLVLGLIAAIAYGAMFALVVLVKPGERTVTIRVPDERLQLERLEEQPAQRPETPAQ